jgi:hypothetical protein
VKSWVELVSEANQFRQSHIPDDGVFQTPDNANILISSSPGVGFAERRRDASAGGNLRMAITMKFEPPKVPRRKVKLDVNVLDRVVNDHGTAIGPPRRYSQRWMTDF